MRLHPLLLCLLCFSFAPLGGAQPKALDYATIVEQLLNDEPNDAHENLAGLLKANPGNADLLALREALPAARPVAAVAQPPELALLPESDQQELEALGRLVAEAKTRRDFISIQPRVVTLLKRHPDHPELLSMKIKVELPLRGYDFALQSAYRLEKLGYWAHPTPAVAEALAELERQNVLQPAAIRKAMSKRPRELTAAHLEAATLASGLARAERRRSASTKLADGTPFLVGDIDLLFVPIPSGTLMLDPPGAYQTRGVKITHAFWLAETEVTQAQWRAVMGSAPRMSNHKDSPQSPVDFITWDEAMAFCDALTQLAQKNGSLPVGHSFSLPTEAQWEFGARAGAVFEFPAKVDALAWHRSNSGVKSRTVATKLPNTWGLYDMQGNLAEWCANTYGSPKGLIDDLPNQPVPSSNADTHRSRGGDWMSEPRQCEVIFARNFGVATRGATSGTQGFRPAVIYTSSKD